jgi:hypothetical protein
MTAHLLRATSFQDWPASRSLARFGRSAFAKVTADSLQPPLCATLQAKAGAGDEARTRDVHLGKVVLYQLSYTRVLRGE